MERMTMKIEGMSCGHCVSQVANALKDLGGVDVEQVEVGTATVAYDPGATPRDRITKAVEDSGYVVTSTGD